MLEQDQRDGQREDQSSDSHLFYVEGCHSILAEVASKHHRRSYFNKFRRLKLTDPGNFDPGAMTIDLQTDARDQHEGQQHEPKDVERWSNIQQLAIIGEGDGDHRNQRNRQADQLLDPEIFRRLGVANLQRAEADDADGKDGQQPVEISKRPFF